MVKGRESLDWQLHSWLQDLGKDDKTEYADTWIAEPKRQLGYRT